MYGNCLNTTSNNCSCIRDIPYNGTCEPYSPPPVSKSINYEIYIETPDALLNGLREIFKNLTVPFILNTPSNITANITSLKMMAVCALTDSSTECVCEDQHIWDSETCNMYGSCLNTTSNNCSCIRDIPYNGTCEPYSPPPVSKYINYEIYIETPDALLNALRKKFKNLTVPFILNTPSDITANVTSLKMTAVCALTDFSTECVCEEQHVWDNQTCNMYGSCLNTTTQNCSCVREIPYNGTCEPYPPTPVSKSINYEIYIEIPNALLNALREIFKNLAVPLILNTPSDITANITSLKMTAVCALTDSSTECVCEEQHVWDNQTCNLYGSCLNTTPRNCSCIRDIPYNGTCKPYPPTPGPIINASIEYIISIETPAVFLNALRNIFFKVPYLVLNTSGDIKANLTYLHMTTVCRLQDNDTQCTCESGYKWNTHTCNTYRSCSNTTEDKCNCIYYSLGNESCELSTEAYTTAMTLITTLPPTSGKKSVWTTGVYQSTSELSSVLPTTDIISSPSKPLISTIPSTSMSSVSANTTSDLISTVIPTLESSAVSSVFPSTSTVQSTAVTTVFLSTSTAPIPHTTSSSVTTLTSSTSTEIKSSSSTASIIPATTQTMSSSSSVTPATTHTMSSSSSVTPATTQTMSSSSSVTPATTHTMSSSSSVTPATTQTMSSSSSVTPATTHTMSSSSSVTPATTQTMSSSSSVTPATTHTMSSSSSVTPATTQTMSSSSSVTPATTQTMSSSLKSATPTSTTQITSSSTTTTITTLSSTSTTTLSSASIPTTELHTEIYALVITILTDWSEDYTNNKSVVYIKLKNEMESAFSKTYENVPGYKQSRVRGFRKGSVIIDSEVIMSVTIQNTTNITSALVKEITAYNYSVSSISVYKEETSTTTAQTASSKIPGNVIVSPSSVNISIGKTLNLTCRWDSFSGPLTNLEDVTWYFNGYMIPSLPNSLTYQKNISNVVEGGSYSCELLVNGERKISSPANVVVYSLPSMISADGSSFICSGGKANTTSIACCISSEDKTKYIIQLKTPSLLEGTPDNKNGKYCRLFNYTPPDCKNQRVFCVFENAINDTKEVNVDITSIQVNDVMCRNPYGIYLQTFNQSCDGDQIGQISMICNNSRWEPTSTLCVAAKLRNTHDLLLNLNNVLPQEILIPTALQNLAEATQTNATNLTTADNIQEIVNILQIVSKSNLTVNDSTMNNFMNSVDAILGNDSSAGWKDLNGKHTNASLELLTSVEKFSQLFSSENKTIQISTANVQLQGINISHDTIKGGFTKTFFDYNTVNISEDVLKNLPGSVLLLSIAFKSLADILKINSANITNNATINGIVMATTAKHNNISNITMIFQKKNSSLDVPNCVFVNEAEWSTMGCSGSNTKDSVICTCNHNTAFSILMSSSSAEVTDIKLDNILTWITYIGVGISIGSLVLCLFIETMVWQPVVKTKQAYMKHLCIVNIALSLLIADIWFIVGAAMDPSTSACKAATFFIHFFYLSLFFWMFIKGLVLLYLTVKIFLRLSKSTILAVSLPVGYGCPLIISIITVAVTEPQKSYIRNNACWLNWDESKALLAFVVPALVIIAVNAIILLVVIVVIVKVLRPSVGEHTKDEDRSIALQIVKTVGLLTPFLGLTWGFGIGTTIDPSSNALKIIFTVLNAFQGFFILVLGTLMDDKVRKTLLRQLSISKWTSQRTATSRLYTVSSSGPVSRAVNRFNKQSGYPPKSNSSNEYRSFSST
ncbi:serine-rich adhesin for platelets-like isoform X2 [Protopterus annectens]|uniref:serine-rich adhesin for platelets-like isoform X2 n=1 Tax=Protopterus annectens TaxID=7888 RepID=UPI001CFB2D9C|nr:serine-rich adhesin for platelets-like isoform X2 [Protopterus annectens]